MRKELETAAIRRTDEGRTLRELCDPLFAFVIALRNASDPGTVETVRRTFERLRRELEDSAHRERIDPDHVQHALFALVALLDETVLRTHPNLMEDWLSSPLQLEVFDETNAGVHFFDRLHGLRGSSRAEHNDLLEIYLFCLSLGFRGRMTGAEGLDELQSLRTALSTEILRGSGSTDQPLSPHAIKPPTLEDRVLELPVWAVAAACLLLVIVYYLIASASATGAVDDVVERIHGVTGSTGG